MFKILKKPNGYSLVGVLVATAIIGIGLAALNSVFMDIVKNRLSISSEGSLGVARDRIILALENEISFSKTLNINADMACVKNRTDCSAKKNVAWPISVMDATNDIIVDVGNAAKGFSIEGGSCTSFDPVAGNNLCPIKYNVTWQPICPPAGPCLNPQNRILGTPVFKSATSISNFNVNKYGFMIIPARFNSSLKENCESMDGNFDPGTGNCALPLVGDCPPGRVVLGITASGQKNCGFLFAGLCPSGQAIDYVDISGNVSCKPILFCPSTTDFSTWIPWIPDQGTSTSADGGDGCDGADGCGS